jgi:SAM-dependent methyltransferase
MDHPKVEKARERLRSLVRREMQEDFGIFSDERTDLIVRDWMSDETNAAARFDELNAFHPGARKILDLACGCGTAVFYGLLNGYAMNGLDPDPGKLEFIRLKADAFGYPRPWLSRFCRGVGEALPYADDAFDAVLSYQTLEHVRDPRQVLAEIIRVTRAGGCAGLRFPDYRGTFEGHYLLPWLPLLPKAAAKAYLRVLGRPTRGLKGITYVTGRSVRRQLASLQREHPSWRLEIRDGSRIRFLKAMAAKGFPAWERLYAFYRASIFLRCLFRRDVDVNLFVRVLAK